ncbi:FG-GAP repeat protein [bacterium]|nr:FG-GAP repeat protein [bacterium]
MNKKNKKNKIIIVILFFLAGIIGFGNQAQAASNLVQITATPSDVTADNSTSYTIAFNTSGTIPNNGKITIQFPAGFDVSGASFISWTGFDAGQSLTVATQTITITRDGLGTSSIGGAKTIVLGDIINTSTAADNYQVIVTTKNAANTALNGPTDTVYFQIFDSHSETNIDGIYYLRDDIKTHYQGGGSILSGNDVGTFSRTAPTSNENRNCNNWIQFYFDENGTYTQANQISNIYYHIWWITSDSQGILGYDKTGVYSPTTDECFTINTADSPNKVVNHDLYAGKQTFAEPQSIFGNAIYNFGIKFSVSSPVIISFPDRSSFIIINLPDNIDTLGISQDGNTDYDEDGLTDYAELFTYYTNPYDADTDDDGWNDKYEVDSNLNPIDPESAPTFGKWLIKQYDGVAAGDSFGWSVSSISDIDGDGKDDVLVGACSTAPGGLVNAGSAYIYSSNTGSLIKQYDGVAAGDSFGWSVSSISDIDGDGKDDVLVGAYGADPGGLSSAGSAYIYSSNTGSLIKQYDGVAAGDYFGYSVSSISDIDGDGKDDVLVGAYSTDPGGLYNAGSAYIYSSDTGSLIKQYDGGVINDNFGYSVSSISDIDGDGKDDVLVGARYAGSAYIYSSNTGELIKQYDGIASNDSFGRSVSSISDIDGDGKDDVLVGAYVTDPGGLFGAGSAYIYSSNTGELIKQYDGIAPNDSFGYSVSSISDIDGDGKDDVLVGARYALSDAGSAYIYSSNNDYISPQSWSKASSNNNSFDLDDYFIDPNNSTIPARNQTVTYTASTLDNPYINVSIDADNNVSFSQPVWWSGTETVVFTATDSTGLSSTSNTVILTVIGEEGGDDDEVKDYCFIATATFGTPLASEVRVLSRFRDSYLLTNPVGEGFVATYYKVSPRAALFIKEHPVLKKAVRSVLNPLIWLSQKAVE